MRKAANLWNFAKRETVLVSEINALVEKSTSNFENRSFGHFSINRRAFCDHLMDVYITLTI